MKGELKVKEYEQFSSVYCGLCHTLKKRYGFLCRFLVNYDFTFLAMLLADEDYKPCLSYRRCSASPFRKKCVCETSRVGEIAADYSIILAYWKLRDSLEDESILKKTYIWPLSVIIRGKYKKAVTRREKFAAQVQSKLKELKEYEQSDEKSIDAAADKFALILEAASREITPEKRRLVTGKLLYHIGRIIYILDAADDMEEDFSAGRHNPIIKRYDLSSGVMDDEIKELLKKTLYHSANIAAADFELLNGTAYTDIISNILYLGIPNTIEMVFSGKWRAVKERLPR